MKNIGIISLIIILLVSCNSKPKFTEEEKIVAHFFIESMNLNNESIKLSNSGSAYKKISDENIQNMLQLKIQALSLAEKIPDSILTKMNPELPVEYFKYKKGLSLRIENLKRNNFESELKGSELLDEYGNWYSINVNNIKIPKIK